MCVGRLGVEMSTVDPLVLTIEERGELERGCGPRPRRIVTVNGPGGVLAADGVAG